MAEPGKTYQYDAENRMKSINNGAIASYVYDASGRRVQKTTGGATTEYLYDPAGNVLAERQGSTWAVSYIYLNGQMLAQYKDNTTHFVHKDHLGSTRVLTKPDRTIQAIYDYLPFGEESSGNTATTHKFTGHERDAESSLDHMKARQYTYTLGRFVSPDPVAGSAFNPQSLNLYAYVWNNPLRLTDPTGMIVSWEDSDAKCKKGETECKTSAQRKYEKTIQEKLNSKDPKTQGEGRKLQAAYERLQKSDITFHVVRNNPAGASSGELTYAGQAGHLYVNLRGNSAEYGALTDVQKIAHEFEHAEQFLDGKLGFYQGDDGKWHGYRDDLVDEAEAFVTGFEAQPLDPAQRGNAFLDAIGRAIPFGTQHVVDVLDRQGPYVGRSRTQVPITTITPRHYAVPRNQ